MGSLLKDLIYYYCHYYYSSETGSQALCSSRNEVVREPPIRGRVGGKDTHTFFCFLPWLGKHHCAQWCFKLTPGSIINDKQPLSEWCHHLSKRWPWDTSTQLYFVSQIWRFGAGTSSLIITNKWNVYFHAPLGSGNRFCEWPPFKRPSLIRQPVNKFPKLLSVKYCKIFTAHLS